MTNNARPVRAPIVARRYPLLGGAVAWYLPILAAVLGARAVAFGTFDVAIGAAALGWAVYRLTRNVVVEVSPTGLTRGVLGMGAFRARTTSIPWGAVAEVHTAWCRPGEDFSLETAVRDREGRTIRLSTAMGLAPYWACLAEVVRNVPASARSGLTDAVLADGPPSRHHVVSALGPAAGLALVLAAFIALHALWAQGRSSLARDLERIGAAGESTVSACTGGSPASGGAWIDSCR